MLIMDKPEKCDYCPVGRIFGMEGFVECRASRDEHTFTRVNREVGKIPDWRPLKDVPDKCWPVGMNFERGWNACIDEILKGCES